LADTTGVVVRLRVTVVAALGGLVLGIRAEQRAGEEQEQTYAKHVDFYRIHSNVTVTNGSTRVMNMRFVLRNPAVWWDLEALRPCKQFDISTGLLLSSMSRERRSPRLTEEDLSGLQLEFMDPEGRVWLRSSGGTVSRFRDWEEPPKGVRLVTSEPWNMRPEDSPECG
jgi:hypothetical protein